MLPADLRDRAARLRLLCTDVDGVLTTGLLHYGLETGHTKAFHVRDGAGIKWLQASGVAVAFISGLSTPATRLRAQDLGIEDCFMGYLHKLPILQQLCDKYGITEAEVAHVGDDLHDLPLLKRVGLAVCPADAVAEVRQAAHWTVPVAGGHGVLRALAEEILKAKGLWDGVVAKYD